MILSFLITLGLFLSAVFLACAMCSDIPWLEIPANIFILVMMFGALWWGIYMSLMQ